MKPAVVGGLVAAASALLTAAYLASIRIDDGLEGLLYLPLLGALLALVAGWAGWRGRPATWALNASLGATISSALALLVVFADWRNFRFVDAAAGAIVVVGGFALTGSFVGWGIGDLLWRLRLKAGRARRDAGRPTGRTS